jgi:hypothetical protein
MEQCPLRNPDDCLAERSMGGVFSGNFTVAESEK